MIDPSGLWSTLFDYLAAKLSSYMQAAHCRGSEEEADELGIQIAALACFDTTAGSSIFSKFAEADHHHKVLVFPALFRSVRFSFDIDDTMIPICNVSYQQMKWSDSHPTSDSRYNNMIGYYILVVNLTNMMHSNLSYLCNCVTIIRFGNNVRLSSQI